MLVTTYKSLLLFQHILIHLSMRRSGDKTAQKLAPKSLRSSNQLMLGDIADPRSPKRIEFGNLVVAEARTIAMGSGGNFSIKRTQLFVPQ